MGSCEVDMATALAASPVQRAARAIKDAHVLIFTAGAGMGVDSGLPDFRGTEGFWKAYPPMAKLGVSFEEMANPLWFEKDPALAWGFYGHRQKLYARTVPHEGFHILRRWAEGRPHFVFTSNVDGHFQKAGFSEDHVFECHGAINYLQCSTPLCANPQVPGGPADPIWPVGNLLDSMQVDETTFRATNLPTCKNCQTAIARPNVMMFGDYGWAPDRTEAQEHTYKSFIAGLQGSGKRVVVIEMGAGEAVKTVRWQSEDLARRGGKLRGCDVHLVRINVRDNQVPEGPQFISVQGGAKAMLQQIDEEIKRIPDAQQSATQTVA